MREGGTSESEPPVRNRSRVVIAHHHCPTQPEEYRWSSDRATAGPEDAPDWLDVTLARIGCEIVSGTN